MTTETQVFDKEGQVGPLDGKVAGRGFEIEHVVGADGKVDPTDVVIHLPGTDLMFEAVYVDGLGVSVCIWRSKVAPEETIC